MTTVWWCLYLGIFGQQVCVSIINATQLLHRLILVLLLYSVLGVHPVAKIPAQNLQWLSTGRQIGNTLVRGGHSSKGQVDANIWNIHISGFWQMWFSSMNKQSFIHRGNQSENGLSRINTIHCNLHIFLCQKQTNLIKACSLLLPKIKLLSLSTTWFVICGFPN